MDDKDAIDGIIIPVTTEAETECSVQQVTEDVKSAQDVDPVIQQESNEIEPMLIDQLDKVQENVKIDTVAEEAIPEASEKVVEPMETDETPMAVDEPQAILMDSTPIQESLTDLASVQTNLIGTPHEDIEPLHEGIIDAGQPQTVPIVVPDIVNDSVKLESGGDDIDQQSVLSMKDSELKDLVMRELSEFLTDEPSQNNGSLAAIKTEDSKREDQKNIENLEHSLSEAIKAEPKEVKKSDNDIADALSTLATAALTQAPTNGPNDTVTSKPTMAVLPVKQDGPAWCDVGVIKGTTCLVKQFYSTGTTDEHENTSLDHLPDYTSKLKIDIQPGTAYKLRIAAINTCGRGEWSEISAFKTCLPGYPGAPSAIKITKAPDGASLTWEAPPSSSGKILEYSVCLAIKNLKELPPQSPKQAPPSLNFVRVYCGPHNAAVVSHESLGAALIDRTNKPAIIFRIAAKNEKGYGPATQVRWLQDSNVPGSGKTPSMKREKSVNLLTGVPKRPKL
ncbi:host cell factor 1-like [Adelges cooleyi]|uniref:host cell factor 1-like n=1 Tax=Adelges cooleyi TaxID=133065 RepID=UPI00217FEE54|nr:host cell factor 1-like [Adelges cooleyi]